MKFGKVDDPGMVDFRLPADAADTKRLLQQYKDDTPLEAYVGCAKWNRSDLKGFYPRGTKDELVYYSRQFNSIELNATFYKMPDWKQVTTWKEKTPEGFRFFPKVTDLITHYRRLVNVEEPLENFCNAVSNFEDRLGMVFMQLHEQFGPKNFDLLKGVIERFPAGIPLALEVRNEQWFSDKKVKEPYNMLLEQRGVTNVIVDTAGRRDMLHMRLTTPAAFIRYVGANHSSDIKRLDDWVKRIKKWRAEGLQKLYFFVHQNVEMESPLLAEHFIRKLNKELGLSLHIPVRPDTGKSQSSLF